MNYGTDFVNAEYFGHWFSEVWLVGDNNLKLYAISIDYCNTLDQKKY